MEDILKLNCQVRSNFKDCRELISEISHQTSVCLCVFVCVCVCALVTKSDWSLPSS